jgi:hypothetical protein
MISVLLEIEMKNGEGLSEGVSAQIRQAFQVFSWAVSSRNRDRRGMDNCKCKSKHMVDILNPQPA